MLDEKLLREMQLYLKAKTGISYFNTIKRTPKSFMVSCPFHKGGQERKPSCGIKLVTDNRGSVGTVHCFSCGVTTNLSIMMQELLGSNYNEDEVESLFGLKTIMAQEYIVQQEVTPKFKIPQENHISQNVIRTYDVYHPYLQQRRITPEVAKIYDIGFDSYNRHITFPIRNNKGVIVGIGRRSIDMKRYIYPEGMIKPVYGVYELPLFIRYLWVCEGPFNIWSLKGWNKTAVALLGTGTETQHKQLLGIDCDGYVLALDPDDAGRNGTYKLAEYLIKHNKTNIFVTLLPDGKDINDLTLEEFETVEVIPYTQWRYYYNKSNRKG